TPCATTTRAPALNEHAGVVLATDFAWANANVRRPDTRRTVQDGPLEDLRVIEVTANWAGPQGGRLMADLGADVIKIELQTKPATRALVTTGGDLWPDSYHRAGYFNKVNRNKRAVALDLSKPEGKATFLELVNHA